MSSFIKLEMLILLNWPRLFKERISPIQRINHYPVDKIYPLAPSRLFERWIALSTRYPADKFIHGKVGSISFYPPDKRHKHGRSTVASFTEKLVAKPCKPTLTSYTDSELRCRYRFGRDAINYIVGLVADDIMPETNRNHAVSAEMQVLITLRYLASGSFLQVIGDTFLGFDKSAVSRVVRRVTQALSAKVGNFVKFPSTRAERDEIKQGLFRVGGFPCAIGCIDGTHVRITAPHENEPDFVNRKGYHSMSASIVESLKLVLHKNCGV